MRVVFLVVLGLSIGMTAPAVTAAPAEARQIGFLEFLQFSLDSAGDYSVKVSVTSGGPVDIYVMDAANFGKMKQLQTFEYLVDYSKENVMSADYTVSVPDDSGYFLIVLNRQLTSATVEVEVRKAPDYTALLVVGIIVVAGIIGLLVFLKKRKGKKQSELE